MKNIPLLLLILLPNFGATCLNAELVKILIQGDTQKIMNSANGEQDNFVPLMAKLLTDPVTRDANFVLQMGDIVESDTDNSDRPRQYTVAREGWEQLDGKIPYVLNLGNNDDADEYFAAFSNLPKPLAENSDRRNFAYSFSSGNIDWLIISMRFWKQEEKQSVKDAEMNWAKELIEENPEKKIIFIKHEVNAESGIVNQLKAYSNVVFILSGHTQSQYEILNGKNGNKIAWIRTCHHDARLDSYFRVLQIDTAEGTVSSLFYSPQYEKFWHDPTSPYHDCVKSIPWTYTGFDFGATETISTRTQKNDAQFVSLDIPCCVIADSEFDATATVLNAGTAKWDASLNKNKYKLGSVNPQDNRDWGEGTLRENISEDVLPGALHTFEISCTAPAETGYYNFRRRMVQEGKEWFGEYSENRIVYVCFNEIANSSFESDGTRSKAWLLGDGASWSSAKKKNGISSLKLAGSAGATVQEFQTEKNTNYSLSFWLYRENAEGLTKKEREDDNAFLDMCGPKDENRRLRLKIARETANGKWVQLSGRFDSGPFTSLNLKIYGNDLRSTVYFDDVIVMKATPYGANFVSAPNFIAYKDLEFKYELDTADFGSSLLEYSFKSIPGWLSFDDESAVLSGTPDNDNLGTHAVTFTVQDGGQEKLFTFAVNVLETPPIFQWNRLHNVDEATSDIDRDGLVSFLEFALGGDPNKSDAVDKLPKFIKDNAGFDFKFRRNQSTLTYTIRSSTDLTNWSDYAIVDDEYGLVGDTCTINIPASGDKRFFKLEIEQ